VDRLAAALGTLAFHREAELLWVGRGAAVAVDRARLERVERGLLPLRVDTAVRATGDVAEADLAPGRLAAWLAQVIELAAAGAERRAAVARAVAAELRARGRAADANDSGIGEALDRWQGRLRGQPSVDDAVRDPRGERPASEGDSPKSRPSGGS
jgi:hypothetical protein